MYFTSLVAGFLLAAELTSAIPLLHARQTSTITPPALYYLQTTVVNGDHQDFGSDKNNLWVYSSHTGAGLGDAALSPNKTDAWQAYLEDSQQYFTYPNNTAGGWPMSVEYADYQEWSPVSISISAEETPYEGFYFNSTGLQYNQSTNGWVACDWWHGVPQLFNYNGYTYGPLAASCSIVELLPVAV